MSTLDGTPTLPVAATQGGLLVRGARTGVLAALERLTSGALTVIEDGTQHTLGRPGTGADLDATLVVHDPGFWTAVATGSSLGAAESYLRGEWDTDDLTTLVRLLARDRHALAGLQGPFAQVRGLALRALHALRRNTRAGSRSNIRAHYDLGNDFFACFLDPLLQYSSAIFPRPEATLAEASRHKLDVICERLGVAPGQEVLEIGTGWGALAVHLATRHGCRVTTTTISREQYEAASARVAAAGVADRVTLLRQDYRDLPRLGRRFDRVVSIEMIEAVGFEYLRAYFGVIDRMLEPDGRALLQAIVIRDQDEAEYRRNVDFIQRYIFPGGALPSVRAIGDAVASGSSLRIAQLDDLTPHYPRTLRAWRHAFEAQRERIRALGFDERFLRLWHWYFCYCEAGFLERTCGLVHVTLAGAAHGRGEGAGVA